MSQLVGGAECLEGLLFTRAPGDIVAGFALALPAVEAADKPGYRVSQYVYKFFSLRDVPEIDAVWMETNGVRACYAGLLDGVLDRRATSFTDMQEMHSLFILLFNHIYFFSSNSPGEMFPLGAAIATHPENVHYNYDYHGMNRTRIILAAGLIS